MARASWRRPPSTAYLMCIVPLLGALAPVAAAASQSCGAVPASSRGGRRHRPMPFTTFSAAEGGEAEDGGGDGAGEFDSEIREFILRGTPVKRNYYRWMGSVIKRKANGEWAHDCGAVLVSDTVALSAAHCFTHSGKRGRPMKDLRRMRFVTGDYLLNVTDRHQMTHAIRRVRLHPSWRSSPPGVFAHDIAAVQLDRANPRRASAHPICVTQQLMEPGRLCGSGRGVQCTAIGWGEQGDVLEETPLPLIPSSRCADAWGDRFDAASMMCGGEVVNKGRWRTRGRTGRGTEAGDSGGPLFCTDDLKRYFLVGIISWGHPIAMTKPAVFTRVSHYYNWVRSEALLLGSKLPAVPDKAPFSCPPKGDRCESADWGIRARREFDKGTEHIFREIPGLRGPPDCRDACCRSQFCRSAYWQLPTRLCQLMTADYCAMKKRRRVKLTRSRLFLIYEDGDCSS